MGPSKERVVLEKEEEKTFCIKGGSLHRSGNDVKLGVS